MKKIYIDSARVIYMSTLKNYIILHYGILLSMDLRDVSSTRIVL